MLYAAGAVVMSHYSGLDNKDPKEHNTYTNYKIFYFQKPIVYETIAQFGQIQKLALYE